MEEKAVSLPRQRDFEAAYRQAYQLAADELIGLEDIAEQCRKSGAVCAEDGRLIVISYFGRPYRIALPNVDLTAEGSKKEVPLRDKLLILHYFLKAGGGPLSGRLITFKELPEGAVYYPNFYKRAVRPILDKLGRRPKLLIDAAKALGGVPAEQGDVSATIKGFPQVPLTVVLWRGDSELPPEGSILFDSSITGYLDTEDITVLCQTMAFRLAGIPG